MKQTETPASFLAFEKKILLVLCVCSRYWEALCTASVPCNPAIVLLRIRNSCIKAVLLVGRVCGEGCLLFEQLPLHATWYHTCMLLHAFYY